MSTVTITEDQAIKSLEKAIQFKSTYFWDEKFGGFKPYQFNLSTLALRASEMPVTDLEALRYILEEQASRFIYSAVPGQKGVWYFWDNTCYVQTFEDIAQKSIKSLASGFENLINEGLFFANNPTTSKEDSEKALKIIQGLKANYKYYSGATGIRNVSYVMKLDGVNPNKFEYDNDYIVMENGWVISTKDVTATPMAPSPERLVARKLGVNLNGTNNQPTWFLSVMEEWGLSKDEIEYLQYAAGCAILGKGGAKNIPTLYGLSNTSKSTYISIMSKVFGSYAGILGAGALVDRPGGTNFEQHTARGKRFIYVEEPKNGKLDDAFLKGFANGKELAEVNTQRKGKDVDSWNVQGVLHIVANKIPQMDTHDDAIVGRIDIVEFTKVYPTNAKGTDPYIDEKIFAAEGPQILLWILEGAIKFLNNRKMFKKPESIVRRALNNVADSSPAITWLMHKIEVGEYVEDYTAKPTNMAAISKELYSHEFRNWCVSEGIMDKDIPTRKEWILQINRYMKEPPLKESEKRPGGVRRFWGIVPSAKLRIKNAQPLVAGHRF